MVAASLRAWLRLYADGGDSHDARVSQALLRVLERAFPLAFNEAQRGAEDGWSAAVKTLEAFYEAPLGVDTSGLPAAAFDEPERTSAPLERLLELALGAVVQSEEKVAFVRDIMTMDASVQVDLMATIEKVMAHGIDAPADRTGTEEDEVESTEGAALAETPLAKARSPFRQRTAFSAGFQSPLHLSAKADFERLKRENAVLRDENTHINDKLSSAQQLLQQRDAEKAALCSQLQELRQERERDLLRKEHSVRALFDDRVQQMQRELEAVTMDLRAKAAVADAVPALRDEIDVLRPAAERVAKMDKKIAKYKAKIEQLAGLNGKLRSVERANEQLMSENLAMEARLSKAASLQRKLDEAKDANTALEFRISDLDSHFSRQSRELTSLKDALEASECALKEARALNLQLQATAAHQLSGEGVSQSESIGDGAPIAVGGSISELNPELMQKLQRLEFENNELKKRVDGETSEHIDSLLDQIADLTRLKKSFEGRYFDAAQTLSEIQAELKDVSALLATTEEKLQETALFCNEKAAALSMAQRDNDTFRATVTRLEDELRQQRHAEATLQALVGSRNQTIETLNATATRLEVTVSVLREREALLCEDVESHASERRTLLDERFCLKRDIQQLRENFDVCRNDLADYNLRLLGEEIDNVRLRRQCESLGMVREELLGRLHIQQQLVDDQRYELVALTHEHEKTTADLSEKLAFTKAQLEEHREKADMQLEDSSARLARQYHAMMEEQYALRKQFDDELSAAAELDKQFAHAHAAQLASMRRSHSDTISRMTETIDAKATALENAVRSLREYKQMHSVSNDEWTLREQELEEELEQSRSRVSYQEARQAELSAALHAQEQKLLRLEEANSLLKEEVAKQQAQKAQLKDAVALLKSKIVLLEKERDHLERQEERQRNQESVSATFSAQQNSQIDAVTAELEKLTREYQDLQLDMRMCRCDRGTNSVKDCDVKAVLLSPEEKKDYYRSRIRHLEQTAQQQDDKRRELVLVNAKLAQEQKQLHIRNAALMLEIQTLQAKLGRSPSREEQESMTRQNELVPHPDTRVSPRQRKVVAANELLTLRQVAGKAAGHRSDDPNQKNDQPIHQPDTMSLGSQASRTRSVIDAKPDILSGERRPRANVSDALVATQVSSAPVAGSTRGMIRSHSEVHSAGVQRSKQRRLAHFFADNTPSTAVKDEKPSECNQQ